MSLVLEVRTEGLSNRIQGLRGKFHVRFAETWLSADTHLGKVNPSSLTVFLAASEDSLGIHATPSGFRPQPRLRPLILRTFQVVPVLEPLGEKALHLAAHFFVGIILTRVIAPVSKNAFDAEWVEFGLECLAEARWWIPCPALASGGSGASGSA